MAKARRPSQQNSTLQSLGTGVYNFLKYLCGTENGRISRSVFWNMIATTSTCVLLILTYFQLQDVKKATTIAAKQLQATGETTSANFSLQIENSLVTPEKMQLMNLFDNDLLYYKSDSTGNEWFELDSAGYKTQLSNIKSPNIRPAYGILEIDELIQNFEDLSFYEKRGQINFEYIYDRYAYYIEMLWQNPAIQKYIKVQRAVPHFSNSYINFEQMYHRMKAKTDSEK